MTNLHKVTMQGQADRDWEVYHAGSIQLWDERYNRCVVGRPIYGQETHTEEYMNWFLRHSRPFISGDQPLRDPRQILPTGVDDDDDDEQQVPPTFATQTERREYNRQRQQRSQPQASSYGQSSSYTPFQQASPNYQQTEDFVPHRHSISHTGAFQNQFEEHTPLQDPHRHSTSQWNSNEDTEWLGFPLGSQESYAHLAYLQQQLAGGSSSTVPQFVPEQPPPAPTEPQPTEEQEQPIRRTRRVPKPRKCGTGGHLFR